MRRQEESEQQGSTSALAQQEPQQHENKDGTDTTTTQFFCAITGQQPFENVIHGSLLFHGVNNFYRIVHEIFIVVLFAIFLAMVRRTFKPCPCLLYTSPSPRDGLLSRMPSSA